MTTRRFIMGAAPALATALGAVTAAQAQTPAPAPAQGSTENVDYLFVQTARRVTFDRATNMMTLHDVSPITVFFSDRPERIAGNMSTTSFVPFWSRGTDSFAVNPPNADISILEGQNLRQVVAVLESPTLAGQNLSYRLRILQGEMPAAAGEVSVFIDVIGMPRTPVSFAGAARRGYRRAYYR